MLRDRATEQTKCKMWFASNPPCQREDVAWQRRKPQRGNIVPNLHRNRERYLPPRLALFPTATHMAIAAVTPNADITRAHERPPTTQGAAHDVAAVAAYERTPGLEPQGLFCLARSIFPTSQ